MLFSKNAAYGIVASLLRIAYTTSSAVLRVPSSRICWRDARPLYFAKTELGCNFLGRLAIYDQWQNSGVGKAELGLLKFDKAAG
jgi:hypothetical protein